MQSRAASYHVGLLLARSTLQRETSCELRNSIGVPAGWIIVKLGCGAEVFEKLGATAEKSFGPAYGSSQYIADTRKRAPRM
jgi:hypothetical protein